MNAHLANLANANHALADGDARAPGRVLLVSNRLMVTARRDGDTIRLDRSLGGLATALGGVHEGMHSWWIGWPGDVGPLDAAQRRDLDERLRDMRATAVMIDPGDVRRFYARMANGILWPLLHDRLDRLPLDLGGWEVQMS